ncbi:hypothetical protein L226DRAFT_6638 [Lentinus tigrinus ALCF2SS1-7]|uniref:uncharacterized protein n=1 Tax=Lentinus tigrinus ALCF2SS1-7 TaxID=1328758 RepID=UPI0011660819|nr:hypothetical protein L226DRAFT_6638 [Lentinus tigrinus ALCF2SS1-7]
MCALYKVLGSHSLCQDGVFVTDSGRPPYGLSARTVTSSHRLVSAHPERVIANALRACGVPFRTILNTVAFLRLAVAIAPAWHRDNPERLNGTWTLRAQARPALP